MGVDDENRSKYYEWLKPLAEAMPDGIELRLAERYIVNFGLDRELEKLPEGSIVYDVGCGWGGPTEGLQQLFPAFTFVGIEPVPLQLKGAPHISVPIIKGDASELPQVKEKVSADLYPPQLVLMRNMLQIVRFAEEQQLLPGLTRNALQGVHDALPVGGKAFIFDGDMGMENYRKYVNIIHFAGMGFASELDNGYDGEPYLRLEKIAVE